VRLVTDAKTAGKDPNYSLGGFIYHVGVSDGTTSTATQSPQVR
jgi:hypothetical protein